MVRLTAIVNGIITYTKIPNKRFKRWSNTVLRLKFREMEKMFIDCMKRKKNLGKNAKTVYQKYKDKIKELEATVKAQDDFIHELNCKLKVLEDVMK